MNVMTLYQVGRWCYLHHIPLVPQIMYRLIFLLAGAVVPMSVEIGEGTQFAYGGNGVVLHGRTRIGRNVLIAPQVTLGGRAGLDDVPIVDDDCYLGAGAKILGPIRLGRGAVIGANAVVLIDVPEDGVAAGVPARVVRVGKSPCQCRVHSHKHHTAAEVAL
jgi:serine O-acetyltransferase